MYGEEVQTVMEAGRIDWGFLLLRVIYFIVIGWWLAGIVTVVAWFFILTIIGIPIGIWLIDRMPTFVTLRPMSPEWHVEGGVAVGGPEQYSWVLRALYFLFIGWWFSFLWLSVAYIALLTIIGLPIAFWMYGRVGAVTTLFRY